MRVLHFFCLINFISFVCSSILLFAHLLLFASLRHNAEAFVAWYRDTGREGAAARGVDVRDSAPLLHCEFEGSSLVARHEGEAVWRFGMDESIRAQRAADVARGVGAPEKEGTSSSDIEEKAGVAAHMKAQARAAALRSGAVYVGAVPPLGADGSPLREADADAAGLISMVIGVPRLSLLCLKRLHAMGVAADRFDPPRVLAELRDGTALAGVPWTPPYFADLIRGASGEAATLQSLSLLDYSGAPYDEAQARWEDWMAGAAFEYARCIAHEAGSAADSATVALWAARDGLPLEALRAYRECAVASRRSVDEELQSLEYDAIASWHAEALAGAAHARHEPGFTPARPAARGCGAYGAYEYAAAAELKDGTTWRVVLLAVTLVVARRLAARFFTVWRWVEAQREALLLAGGDAGGVATKLRESLAVELTGERADDEAAYSRAIGELQCDAEGVMVVDAQSECEAKLRELRTELGERWATHRSALRHLDARIVMQRTAEEAAGQAALAPFCLLCGDSVGEGGGR